MIANRLDNAAIDFQRAIELDKSNTKQETLFARYFLATCYEKLRKIEKAIEQWEEIYKVNKSFRDVSTKLSEYKDLQNNDFLKDYPVRFQRQKVIDSFIVDFYCASAKLMIELDGSQHFSAQGLAYDEERSAVLSKYGLAVLRFTTFGSLCLCYAAR